MRKEENSIRKQLMEELTAAVSNNEKYIPAESVLAEKLGISRTQLRDYLGELESEGLISRRRGIGTQINQHVLEIPLRMDFEIEYADRVRAMGMVPETVVVGVSMIMSDELTAGKLNVGIGTPILRVEKVVKADEREAIFCIDNISYQIIKDYSFTEEELRPPIFDFLYRYCHTRVDHDLSEVTAVVADEKLAGHLGLRVGAPLLNMNEQAFDIDGNPIMWTQEYYVPGVIKYTVMRKNAVDVNEEKTEKEE